jgi:hypothetical protein
MLLCSVHSSSARHLAVGNPWRGRSSFLLHQEILRSLGAVLNDLRHHAEKKTSKNLKPSPLPGAPNVGRKSPTGWRNAPALNPKMMRGLSVLPVRWKREERKNTQGFRVVQAAGA